MSLLFDRVPRAELGTRFRYKGWLFGLVPIYIDDPDAVAPLMTERNGVPRWWFDLVSGAFEGLCMALALFAPDVEPLYFFTVTGEIEPPRSR